MIIVDYAKQGLKLADHEVEETIRGMFAYLSEKVDHHFFFATENALLCIRALIAEGVISSDAVEFYVDGEFFTKIDELGTLDTLLPSPSVKWLDRALTAALNQKETV